MGYHITGLLIFAIIFIIFWVAFSSDEKKKAGETFDERQLLERGNAFKYGFYVALLELGLLSCVSYMDIDITEVIPAEPLLLIAFFIPIAVFCFYAIMKDAFMVPDALASRKMYVVYIIVIACNLVSFVIPVAVHGAAIDNYNWATLLICFLFTMIMIACIIRNRKSGDED